MGRQDDDTSVGCAAGLWFWQGPVAVSLALLKYIVLDNPHWIMELLRDIIEVIYLCSEFLNDSFVAFLRV